MAGPGDDDAGASAPSTASQRVAQVSGHIDAANPSEPNTSRRRRRAKKDDLPADWSDVLDQVKILQQMAATPDPTKTGYVRQKQAGKLWVRDRVDQLLDPGSFRDIGSVAGTAKWKKIDALR